MSGCTNGKIDNKEDDMSRVPVKSNHRIQLSESNVGGIAEGRVS